MKTNLFRLAFMTFAALCTFAAAYAQTPQEVLVAADRVRNPGEPFRVTLGLVEYINGKARDRTGLIVYSKEDKETRQYADLVRYSEPPRDAGKLVLLKSSNLWFYDPASKASIRISAQQRLIGQASDGDVLTVNLAHDYNPRLVGEEAI